MCQTQVLPCPDSCRMGLDLLNRSGPCLSHKPCVLSKYPTPQSESGIKDWFVPHFLHFNQSYLISQSLSDLLMSALFCRCINCTKSLGQLRPMQFDEAYCPNKMLRYPGCLWQIIWSLEKLDQETSIQGAIFRYLLCCVPGIAFVLGLY